MERQNRTNNLAALGLILAQQPREPHPAIQDFILANDAITVACEVPVYLSQEDISYFRSRGFITSLPDQLAPITGYIDILQIRGGLIRILDYKLAAHKISPPSS